MGERKQQTCNSELNKFADELESYIASKYCSPTQNKSNGHQLVRSSIIFIRGGSAVRIVKMSDTVLRTVAHVSLKPRGRVATRRTQVHCMADRLQ